MLCPACGTNNLPGVELCEWCLLDLSLLDLPQPFDRVDGSLMADTVEVLKPKPPICISVNALLGQAVALMVSKSVGSLLVTDNAGKLVGILTERDFLTRVAGRADFASQPLRAYMTRDPETIALSDPLGFALAKMDTGGYRHLPVTVDGVPIGIVSARDVLAHFLWIAQQPVVS